MLAVVSAIFLPITFLAGVYGTNFDQWFPEVRSAVQICHSIYGHCITLGLCWLSVGLSTVQDRWSGVACTALQRLLAPALVLVFVPGDAHVFPLLLLHCRLMAQ
jgi:hypothetical protein